MSSKWINWAGNQSSDPEAILAPATEDEVSDIVSLGVAKRLKVRPLGSGHSFSSICSTDGYLMSLKSFNKIISIDRRNLQVTVGAGITLSDLNAELDQLGLALPNLGDIDSQTLAGAISTGTHGTGANYNSISSAIAGLRIVTGDGSIINISETENSELFQATKVSLGALGIIISVTLQCVKAFNLEILSFIAPLPEIISRFKQEEHKSDFVEFFWFPHTEIAEIKISNRTGDPPSGRNAVSQFINDEIIRNAGFELLNRFWMRFPGVVGRSLQKFLKEGESSCHVDVSHKVFCSKRRVKFTEMEYAVPRECLFEAFEEVRLLTHHLDSPVTFPVEVRTLGSDSIPLSMASGRESGFIAVHLYKKAASNIFFSEVEKLMRKFDGRPHWGKIHNLESTDLSNLYFQWDYFSEVRQLLDPDGHFTNPYLERVLGY